MKVLRVRLTSVVQVGKFTRLDSEVQVENLIWQEKKEIVTSLVLIWNIDCIVWPLLHWTLRTVWTSLTSEMSISQIGARFVHSYHLKQLDGKSYWWIILIIDITGLSSECRKKSALYYFI